MSLSRGNSGGRTGLGILATASLVLIALGLLALVLVGLLNVWDPFGTTTVDRSGPAVLQRIRTLEEFTAAEATFTQDVDLENDSFLPGFIKGERVTAIVTGSVRATVDFGELGPNSIKVSDDGTSIQITLPDPQLSDPEIDEGSARVVSRDRGIVDRIEDVFSGNPTDDTPVYKEAEKKLEAAASQSDVIDQARTNTEQWLRTFLGAAGFEKVEINWAESPG
jgi:hypothetical protein